MIKLSMTKGRTLEQKLEFHRRVTALAAEVLACPPTAISVLIEDHYSLDEWSVGGQTWQEIVDQKKSVKIE